MPMITMTPATFRAIRQALFFTPTSAAQLLSSSAAPISEHLWLEWESGKQAIPEALISRILELNELRNHILDATADNIRVGIKQQEGLPESVFVIWYDCLDDWLSFPKREAIMWPLQQSVCAGLASMFNIVKLITFDASAYSAWRGDREDTEALRAEWAASLHP